MKKNDLRLCIIMNPDNQYYFSGFKAVIYSRPIVLTVGEESTGLIIPGLEEEHANEAANVDKKYVYFEHPEEASRGISYMDHLEEIIKKLPGGIKIGVEFNYMPIMLSNYLKSFNFQLVDISKKITEMRFIKDEQEIEQLIEAGKLVSLALAESLKSAKSGISEMELDQCGNKTLFEEVAKKYPDATLDYFVMSPSGLTRSVMPHVFSNTRRFKEQDIIIHSRQVGLNGYRAECERTFFIGKPTKEQEKIFNIVLEAHTTALNTIKPGVKAKEVDLAARWIFTKSGLSQYCIHRTGHGIGIAAHEEPYLRFDYDLTLQEGMVFSIEPGLYIPGVGGFRHSDTVILTKNGMKLITEYPIELNDLIF